jgi:hypothetical protein
VKGDNDMSRLFPILFLLAGAFPLQTLDMASFMDTGVMFGNANVLLLAFGGLVMLVVGFHLAKIIIRFVINMFQSFSI